MGRKKSGVGFIKECNTQLTNVPKLTLTTTANSNTNANTCINPTPNVTISSSMTKSKSSFDTTNLVSTPRHSNSSASKRSSSNCQNPNLTTHKYSASLTQKLKDTGRATIILILISVFFVLFNMPYIIVWACFFIPYKQGWLESRVAIYYRYAWVQLVEIFHIANFCVNLFLYCLGSKLFRNELAARFGILKTFKFSFTFKRN